MWRDGETPDLPSEWCFSGSEYPEYGKPFKSRLQRKKMPKIDLYPDSKLPCLSIVQSKENRLPHRPIDSAIGTGGLDLLIAHALMILCHSLFEVVIEPVFNTGNVTVGAVGVDAVKVVVDGDVADIVLRESIIDIQSRQSGVSPKP